MLYPMRDIQSDLKERLQLAEAERGKLNNDYQADVLALEARYTAKVLHFNSEIEAIQSLLDIETRRQGDNQGQPGAAPSLDIKDFIVKIQ